MQQYRKNLGKVSLTAEGVWDGSKAFDILSIVYDEHTQHGFISRQAVPEGVDLYNKEYWMPFNVSGYADNNVIILSKKTAEHAIQSYTLEEAIASIKSVGRRPGAILGFYNENADRLDIGGRWELWQFNDTNIYNWDNVDSWQNLYYNYNKFMGWYQSEEHLKKYAPFPEIGCYAFVGSEFNEATVYRCDSKYIWNNTTQHAWDYVKVVVDGNVAVGENGNWFNNGEDTGIPASVKGENGKTPVFREKDNTIQYSFDNVNWITISDKLAAWFRWNATTGDTQANNVGRIQISRDNVIWTNLSGDIINNLHISRYIGADESLPTSGIAEGTIYAKGPSYNENDVSHANPIYRLWVYAWKGNTLAWQDNGEFTSIAAGVVQETGDSETEVMSQKAVTEKLSELGSKTDVYFIQRPNTLFDNFTNVKTSSGAWINNLVLPKINGVQVYTAKEGNIYIKKIDTNLDINTIGTYNVAKGLNTIFFDDVICNDGEYIYVEQETDSILYYVSTGGVGIFYENKDFTPGFELSYNVLYREDVNSTAIKNYNEITKIKGDYLHKTIPLTIESQKTVTYFEDFETVKANTNVWANNYYLPIVNAIEIYSAANGSVIVSILSATNPRDVKTIDIVKGYNKIYIDNINLEKGEYLALKAAAGILYYNNKQGAGIVYDDLSIVNGWEVSYNILYVEYKNIESIIVNKTSESLYNKKWACIGDSLTERNIRTSRNYHDFIKEEYDMNIYNFGVSGVGYKDNEFYNKVSEIPNDVDVITFFGSGNDSHRISTTAPHILLGNVEDIDNGTLCGYINKTLLRVIELFPTTPIGVITPTPWYGEDADMTPQNHGNDMENYVNAIVEICKRLGVPCLDLYHCSNLHPETELGRQKTYSKDGGNGVHPDENGHKLIASKFKSFLETLLL